MASVTAGAGNGGRRSKHMLEFEINIVPIIDCLTILVTFMLAAGVYYSIAMLDVKVAGGRASSVQNRPSDIEIAVELQPSLNMVLHVTGKEKINQTYPAADGRPDTQGLQARLGELKAKYGPVDTVTLNANKQVAYQNLVQVLETIRRNYGDVLLGGF